MRKSHWIGGALIVFAALVISLTIDPLGFMDDDVPAPSDELTGAGLERTEGGLIGRGTIALPDADPAEWQGDPVGRLTLSLGTAALKGSVVNAEGPLRFARVRVVLPPPYGQVGVRSRKDGTWEIAGLPAGSHELRASADEHLGRTVTAPPVAAKETVAVEAIELLPRTANTNAIQVKVTDVFGNPISAARVLATTMPWDLHLAMGPELAGVSDVFSKSGTTDENGKVVLGPLPPENYAVVAMAPGYVNAGVDRVVVSDGRQRSVGLRLIEGVSVRGRVTDNDGNGIADAMVMGFAQPSFFSSLSTRTEADGSFVLDGLRKSAYMFVAFEDKHGTAMVPGTSPGTIQIKLGGAGHVKGKVVWDDGTPVTDGQVRPFKIGPFQYVYSMVHKLGADGTFEFDVPAGDWNCRVQSTDGTMTDGTMVNVEVDATSEVVIKLTKSGVVRGVVVDESGNHIAGAEVFVMQGGFPESPSREQYARTNGDGTFEVRGLPLEAVSLHVRHASYADTKIQAEPASTDKAEEMTVRLTAGASVSGKVLDSDGTGVADEQVNLTAEGAWFEARSTYTLEDGSFRFDAVKPGTYMSTTGPFEQGGRGLSKSGIQVGESGVVTVEFRTPAAAGTVTGLVSLAGKPVAGARVTLVDARGAEKAVAVSTDETGRFVAPGLQYGSVRITAKTTGGLIGSLTASVAEGAAPTDVTVEIGSATIAVRTLDDQGEVASGCWISIELVGAEDEGWGRVKDNGNSDVDGRYLSKGLQPGTYTLRVNRVDYAQYVSPAFTLAEGEAKDLGDVRIARGVVLQGVVKNDAGSPVEKATVSLKDMAGREIQLFSMATSGSDGRYAMHGVEAGRYIVHVQAKGHAHVNQEVEISEAGASMNAVLARGCGVQVLIVDPSGAPVTGARVRLFDDKGAQVTRTISLANFDTGRRYTDGEGKTRLDDLAAGSYVVRAELEGWALVGSPGRARVESGGVAEVRMTMEKLP